MVDSVFGSKADDDHGVIDTNGWIVARDVIVDTAPVLKQFLGKIVVMDKTTGYLKWLPLRIVEERIGDGDGNWNRTEDQHSQLQVGGV